MDERKINFENKFFLGGFDLFRSLFKAYMAAKSVKTSAVHQHFEKRRKFLGSSKLMIFVLERNTKKKKEKTYNIYNL
jgi:hypothetical protein